MAPKVLLGFRQYLNSTGSYEDLKKIILESHRLFLDTNDILFVSAICGDNPKEFLKQQNLQNDVHVIEVNATSAEACAQAALKEYTTNGGKVLLIHYSEEKKGLTFPFVLLTTFANELAVELLGLSDSDFQIPYSGIRRSLLDARQRIANRNTPILYLPTRSHRSLESEGYPINRFATEDIENMYYWLATKQEGSVQPLDIQSGLSFMNAAACAIIDNSGVWSGAIDRAIQVAEAKGDVISGVVLDTNPQNESTISPEVQFKKIAELETRNKFPLKEVIEYAITHEHCFMDDWSKHLRPEEQKNILDTILTEYEAFTRSS